MSQVHAKVALRKQLRRRRRALDADDQRRAADGVKERLAALPAFRRSARIALYLAADGEIDPAAVMAWSWANDKRCYAPVVTDGDKTLRFAEVTERGAVKKNRFGIDEPVTDELIDARDLDLALVPLVGFDARGNRLGMGGGFYDATFAYKKTSPHKLPKLIGLAHEIQRVEKINRDAWDIPIDAVVTERRVYHCEK